MPVMLSAAKHLAASINESACDSADVSSFGDAPPPQDAKR